MKILHVEGGRHLYGGALQVVFLLRGLLCTQPARDIAAGREAFMRDFLTQFYAEWNGER